MSLKCRDIMWFIDDFAPSYLAEAWDNSGLNIGNPDAEIKKVLVALDATEEVVDEAIAIGANMIITHHPMLFRGVKSITADNAEGRKIIKLIKNDIAILSAHTNLDSANGGTNDELARIIGLSDVQVLIPSDEEGMGMGRFGEVDGEVTLGTLSVRLKEELDLDAIRVVGNLSKIIRKVAVVTGSGFEFLDDAVKAECDVFVTSDFKYHEAQLAIEKGIALIDATHYGSENIIVPVLINMLNEKVKRRGEKVEIVKSNVDGQVFVHI